MISAVQANLCHQGTRLTMSDSILVRVDNVIGPGGVGLSAVGTGHLKTIAAPGEGILARFPKRNPYRCACPQPAPSSSGIAIRTSTPLSR